MDVKIRWIDSELLTKDNLEETLAGIGGIVVPGGFGHRGIEGKVLAARFARERRLPYLGLCLGLQCAVIEFARDVLGTEDANSTEFDMFTEHPVIDFMPDQRTMEEKGGTMRLGLYPARLTPGSKAAAVYGTEVIYERHRHRFEVNNRYRPLLEAAGMILSGQSPDGRLVEIIELRDHPWFVASQFHPEFRSRPDRPHPLFDGFIGVAVAISQGPRAGVLGSLRLLFSFFVYWYGVLFFVVTGGGLATNLIREYGPLPIVAMRIAFGAALLVAFQRARVRGTSRAALMNWSRPGVILAAMNSLFTVKKVVSDPAGRGGRSSSGGR